RWSTSWRVSHAQQRILEEARGDGAHAHEPLVEIAIRARTSFPRAIGLPQREDRVLAKVVRDRLRRPLAVAVDRARRVVAYRLGRRIIGRALAGAGKEVHVLGEVIHRFVERHAPGVDPDIDTNA